MTEQIDFTADDINTDLQTYIAARKAGDVRVTKRSMPKIDAELTRLAHEYAHKSGRGLVDGWREVVARSKIEGTTERTLFQAHYDATLDLVRRHD